MKIADHIKHSLDACDSRDLDKAMLFACLAVDGTAKKMYPQVEKVGDRFRKFIVEHLDIIELMFGGLNLQETVFPFKDNKGNVGVKFEDIVYEKFRCNLAHGNELPEGYGITVKVADGIQQFMVDIENQSMTFPESAIYALGLPCVLALSNADQKIGSNLYHYRDPINHFVVDHWWGKVECARSLMDFENQVKIKMDFSNVWPAA
ncbi:MULTISPECIES: hypothetical protein [Acidithiobacillus]|uniref:Uncharacterized protein n=2 Tax=Acidithiobacillus TaxID=119977 RepID=A0A179BNY0_ACIFR|nr:MULTISPECIES: hypothetical protein [Acidithiobacillus]MEB8486382.1 hypothetical protein [Acidithiobacillus ferriphilus]MEB8488604.1 hypothetical protein [Acidithiobacillus ferriphilus]MEB8494384.1 hypothetical protein [Acidithiobacillus ferriphilus]MEB8515152.1 hypothetical protein [Acidithiobacillus ferriphilus]MEB8522993.1 hypothetical protein [Acidithiobacillus ferriphilus]